MTRAVYRLVTHLDRTAEWRLHITLTALAACLVVGPSWAGPKVAPTDSMTFRIRDRVVDADRDGFFDALVVEVSGHLPGPGFYEWEMELGQEACPDCAFADSVVGTREFLADARGEFHEQIEFDGDDVRTLADNAPWCLCGVIGRRLGGLRHVVYGKTRSWDRRRFGTRAVYVDAVRWRIVPDSSHVVVDAELDVRCADSLVVDAVAEFKPDGSSEVFHDSSHQRLHLERGLRSLHVELAPEFGGRLANGIRSAGLMLTVGAEPVGRGSDLGHSWQWPPPQKRERIEE